MARKCSVAGFHELVPTLVSWRHHVHMYREHDVWVLVGWSWHLLTFLELVAWWLRAWASEVCGVA